MIESILNNVNAPTVLLYIIGIIWGVKQLNSLTKLDVKSIYKLNQEISNALNPKCEEIANILEADRVLFWQFRNGNKFMKNWPDKDMSVISEYYNKETQLEFSSKYQNVPLKLYGRLMQMLVYGVDDVVKIDDDEIYNDTLSIINKTYGMRSLAMCFCKTTKGKILGILMIGWSKPNMATKIDDRVVKIHSYGYSSVINSIIKNYKLINFIVYKFRKNESNI